MPEPLQRLLIMARLTDTEIKEGLARCLAGNLCRWKSRRAIGADVSTERCNVLNLVLYLELMDSGILTTEMRYDMECKTLNFCHCLGPCRDSAQVTVSQDSKGITSLRNQTWQNDITPVYVVSEDGRPLKSVSGQLNILDKGVPTLDQVLPMVKVSDTAYRADVKGPLDTAENYQLRFEVTNYCGTVIVVEPVGPAPCSLAATVAVTNVTCNGAMNGEATITPVGGTAPYTYEWNSPGPNPGNVDTASHLIVGPYKVKITDDNGCIAWVTFAVTEPARLSVTITDIVQPGASASNGEIHTQTSGGTGPYTYQWYDPAPPQDISGETSEDIVGVGKGIYTLVVTDANGCEYTLGPLTLDEILS